MMSKLSKFTLRVSEELLRKVSYIANLNSRSTNREIEMLLKIHVAEYEEEHGLIKTDK